MGRIEARLVVTARLSDHNSEQDKHDREAWELFISLVKSTAEYRRFSQIDLFVTEE